MKSLPSQSCESQSSNLYCSVPKRIRDNAIQSNMLSNQKAHLCFFVLFVFFFILKSDLPKSASHQSSPSKPFTADSLRKFSLFWHVDCRSWQKHPIQLRGVYSIHWKAEITTTALLHFSANEAIFLFFSGSILLCFHDNFKIHIHEYSNRFYYYCICIPSITVILRPVVAQMWIRSDHGQSRTLTFCKPLVSSP